jgi:hypothetical protein
MLVSQEFVLLSFGHLSSRAIPTHPNNHTQNWRCQLPHPPCAPGALVPDPPEPSFSPLRRRAPRLKTRDWDYSTRSVQGQSPGEVPRFLQVSEWTNKSTPCWVGTFLVPDPALAFPHSDLPRPHNGAWNLDLWGLVGRGANERGSHLYRGHPAKRGKAETTSAPCSLSWGW